MRFRTVAARAAIAGVVAGILAAVFLTIAGEPALEEAIRLEAAADAGHDHGDDGAEVSRDVQKGPGLFGAYALAGAGFGVLLALAYGVLARHVADPFRRVLVAGGVLATSFTLLPWLKYPPDPPGVEAGESIGDEQRLYVLLIVLTLLILGGGIRLAAELSQRGWTREVRGAALAAAVGVALLLVLGLMPGAADPGDVPAGLLWRFRVASLGGNAVLWVTLTLGLALLVRDRSPDRHETPLPVR